MKCTHCCNHNYVLLNETYVEPQPHRWLMGDSDYTRDIKNYGLTTLYYKCTLCFNAYEKTFFGKSVNEKAK